MKIAVVLHLFYDDLAMEFIKYLRNIPVSFDIFISTTPQAKQKIDNLFSREFKKSKVYVTAAPNRGQDIAPFIIEFVKFYPKYDLICKVHGKKSPQAITLNKWREYLLYNLLGSQKITKAIISYFKADKNLGIVFPEKYDKIIRKDLWRENLDNCLQLGDKLDLSIDTNNLPPFPTGSMFWFRPKALSPLFALEFKYNDFVLSSDGKDRALIHAIERLFVLIAKKQGYNYKKVLFKTINSKNILISIYLVVKKHLIYRLPYLWQKKIYDWVNSVTKK